MVDPIALLRLRYRFNLREVRLKCRCGRRVRLAQVLRFEWSTAVQVSARAFIVEQVPTGNLLVRDRVNVCRIEYERVLRDEVDLQIAPCYDEYTQRLSCVVCDQRL